MKKKIFIISIISIIVIGMTASGILFYINSNKKIVVNEIEVVDILAKGNSAEAVELIKQNTVRIANKIDDKNIIYGTGFFDKSGYLVTNSHVVDIKGNIEIIYEDGTKSKANLVSNDITSDLAILSVKDVKAKALSSVSTIDLKVTDEVYSIGYQFNLEGDATVTKGILSAKRSASGIEFLQTDAAVNPGNSGGPLINDKGELLGIITLAVDNASMSMAISSDSLELYINKLRNNKKVNYITTERPKNALSTVLNEVGYKHDDIYNEKHIFEIKQKDNKNEESKNEDNTSINSHESNNNKTNNNTNNNSKPSKTENKKENKIELIPNIELPYKQELSKNPSDYFILGEGLTNCTINTDYVNISMIGKYEIYLTCDQTLSSNWITLYDPDPKAVHNVTSFDQVIGTWYYQNYNDVCVTFKYDRGVYTFGAQKFDLYAGRLALHIDGGGGTNYYTIDDIKEHYFLHLEGNELTITINGWDRKRYTFTRIKGQNTYDPDKIDNWCE